MKYFNNISTAEEFKSYLMNTAAHLMLLLCVIAPTSANGSILIGSA